MTQDIELYIKTLAKLILRDLDPSLFQNIILGILAIFIPFAIVFLTNLLDSNKQRSEFEKMVLSEEVLGTKTIFWLSVFGIIVLAFFSGSDISHTRKVVAVIIALVLTLLLWRPFGKILRFSEGYKSEFEIRFLKSLRLSRLITIGNKLTMDRMVRAWNSFWSEKSSYNEREFTRIFVNHIDEAINRKRYGLAVQLGQTYERNIDKRDMFSIGSEILPKIFEWHENFWNLEQEWLRREDLKEKVRNSISSKYFPTFKKWAYGLMNRTMSYDYFWNWHYFQQGLLKAVAKAMLQNEHGSYQLFTLFKKYIDDTEVNLEKIESKETKERRWNFMLGYFSSFCPMFFETIDSIPSKHTIWHHYFPNEWKVTSANSKKRVPRIILHEFLEWTRQRIFKENGSGFDKNLTEVASGIFPSAHPVLFPVFLIILFCSDIKHAIQRELNFSLITMGIVWSGEKNDEDIQKMLDERNQSQMRETVNIIFGYFGNDWRFLKIYKDDISKEELSNWENYSEAERKEIVSRVRKSKLKSVLNELDSAEVVTLCKESEYREYQRKSFLELIELLLKSLT